MLLYTEDLLDMLDQATDLYFGEKTYCNTLLAYDIAELNPGVLGDVLKDAIYKYDWMKSNINPIETP